MKLKEGFITSDADGEQIMVATGEANFAGIVRSNKTAAFIVDCLKEEITEEQLLSRMLEKYDVNEQVAEKDLKGILEKLSKIGALDE